MKTEDEGARNACPAGPGETAEATTPTESRRITRRMALRLIGRGAAATTGTIMLGKGVAVATSEPAIMSPDDFIQYRAENNFMASAIERGDLVLLAKEREPVQHRGLYGVPRTETRRFITTAKWAEYSDGIPVPVTDYFLFTVRQGRGPGVDASGNLNKSPIHAFLFRCDDWEEMLRAGYFARHSQTARTLTSAGEYYLGSFNIEKEHPTAHPIVWVSKQQTGRNWDRDWEFYHSGRGAS